MSESLFNKVAGSQVCNFVKKILQYRCFPVKFAKFLITLFFFQKTPSGCFWKMKYWNAVFWLLVQITFLNNLDVKNMFLKICVFSLVAMHFLYTIIMTCNIQENKKSSRKFSWKVLLDNIVAGTIFPKFEKIPLSGSSCNYDQQLLMKNNNSSITWQKIKITGRVSSSLQWPVYNWYSMDTLLFLVCRNQNFSWNCQEESKLKFCKDHSFSLKAVGHIKTTTKLHKYSCGGVCFSHTFTNRRLNTR